MTKIELENMYAEYLKQNGFLYEVDTSGAVKFKFEGFSYGIVINENDENYFSMFMGLHSYEPSTDTEIIGNAYDVANRITQHTRATKILISDDKLKYMISFESFIPEPEAFKSIFLIGLVAMKYCFNQFIEALG